MRLTPQRLSAKAAPSGSIDNGRRSLRMAWVSVVAIPLAFVAAMFVGEGLLSMQGYESGGEEFPPIHATLLSAVPAIVIMIAPAISAIWFGFRARRQGVRSGLIPAVVGVAAATITILTNTLPRIVGT